jgi:hypothetical protein
VSLQSTRHRLLIAGYALSKRSLSFSGSLTLIVVDFLPISSTYDEWQTLYSLRAAKILLLILWARTR